MVEKIADEKVEDLRNSMVSLGLNIPKKNVIISQSPESNTPLDDTIMDDLDNYSSLLVVSLNAPCSLTDFPHLE